MPQRRPTPRPRARVRGARGRLPRALLVGVLTGAVLVGTAGPAQAVPPPPPNPSEQQLGDAQAAKDAAAAEVGRIAGLVAQAAAELERLAVQAEAAGTALLAAEEALVVAQEAADRAAAELRLAGEAVTAAERRIAGFSRDSYMNGSTLTGSAALLDAEGPGELIQRAALLDYVAETQLDVLGALEIAKVRQANADSAARAARDEMAAAEAAAEAAKIEADRQVAAQQTAYAAVEAQKATYEQQLQDAQVRLLELQGARDAYRQWVAQKEAEEAAARAEAERLRREAEQAAARARSQGGGGGGTGGGRGYVRPTGGYVSSCFGSRWGTLHGGVDIAAPIGTPVYAATSGTVVRTGAATGFGLAVYIRGDDGAITVYGHVNREFVRTGERVGVGEVIAEVGNRGQSTGPHLHFEVHPGGSMHSGHTDPVSWLRARGVPMERC
ncbi:M23 family metallopeptidase [Geodermatophilus sp. YIM 151500]|uniref:M23 family metallopeptidase n=1 Tax=Geodermatophilus sp. YIM 151500 TaxID=2984531 RepID=UPI0021E3E4BA|nr:M23 family metallopeptidase [Geodermatophilus sp. YIM 151500]MCV2490308.1 M23 family metallopeptidase [Geodermatophilus sp. YIM 151500]